MMNRKGICFRLTGCLLAVLLILCAVPQEFVYGQTMETISGADRYRTAVAISQKGWKESEYVVIVRGDDFADALCAGPLAAKYSAPILFTGQHQLNSYTLNEIRRLKASQVIIVGGYSVLYGNIEQNLYAAGLDNINVERIYGENRYETSVEIAKRMGSKEVAIAVGDQYADALSISAVAAARGMSILLTAKDTLPDVVKRHLSNYKVDKTYIIGGTGVIGQNVERQLSSPKRLAGSDRYDTNRKILEQFASDLDFNKIYITSGEGDGYADSLAGVVLAAKSSSPIVLGGKTIAEGTRNFLKTKMTVASKMVALGGEAAVSSAVMQGYQSDHDSIRKSVFSQKGEYGPSTGTTTIAGNLAIEAADVVVQNTVIEGDLLLGEEIGTGDIQLRNVTVKGRTTVRGGREVSASNFIAKNLVIDLPDQRMLSFIVTGKSKIDLTRVESRVELDDAENTGDGFNEVRIVKGQDITLKGAYTTVTASANGASIWFDDTTVKTYNAIVKHSVHGSGTIAKANVSANDVEFSFAPTSTVIEKGYKAYIAGQYLSEGTHKGAASKKK